MFERFSDQARHVVVMAQEEARALGHDHIGTEHLLLGLLRDADGVGARTLQSLGMDAADARARVASLVPAPASRPEPTSPIPFTPRAKKALELALREALRLNSSSIGTEHVLLGLLDVGDSGAVAVLRETGLEPKTLAARTIELLTVPPEPNVRRGPSLAASRVPPLPADVVAFLAELAREVREQLGREPDIADYLLALASVPDSLGAHLLAELRIDAAALERAIERARALGGSPLGGMTPDQAARYARLILGLTSPD